MRWGEHRAEIPHINQVHTLEHGGILIQYNCDRRKAGTICFQMEGRLRKVFNQARNETDRKIILAPCSRMERSNAVTAWTRLQYFDEVDEEGFLAFARALINSAPERVE